jgi:uncharacterized protein YjiS (DUF1127 family)
MSSFATSALPPSSHELHRRARRARALLVHVLMRQLRHKAVHRIMSLRRGIASLAIRLAREWYRRRTIHELRRLDDRALADIGIGRGEIEFAVRDGRPPRTDRRQAA